MATVTFYEVAASCPSRLPEGLTEHERQLFDVINDVGAIDLRLLSKRSHGELTALGKSLEHLVDIGAIEKRTVEVLDT